MDIRTFGLIPAKTGLAFTIHAQKILRLFLTFKELLKFLRCGCHVGCCKVRIDAPHCLIISITAKFHAGKFWYSKMIPERHRAMAQSMGGYFWQPGSLTGTVGNSPYGPRCASANVRCILWCVLQQFNQSRDDNGDLSAGSPVFRFFFLYPYPV